MSAEIWDLCKNPCKLKKMTLRDEQILWGFMCGRDDTSQTHVPLNLPGFNLLKSRRRIFNARPSAAEAVAAGSGKKAETAEGRRIDLDFSLGKFKENVALNLMNIRHKIFTVSHDEPPEARAKNSIQIGIPSALYLQSHLPFWRFFFKRLGYGVVLTAPGTSVLEKGKEIAGAEFCAPISCWYGQVADLGQRADYLFLPQLFAVGETDAPKFYCYYSNYAVAMVQNTGSLNLSDRCISPVLDFSKPAMHNVRQIYESLPGALKSAQSPAVAGRKPLDH